MCKTEGSVRFDIVNSFRFTVEKYIAGRKKLKPSKMLEMLTTLSFWFEDLKQNDIKKIQDDIRVYGEKIFTDIEINSNVLKGINDNAKRLDIEMCLFSDLIQRSQDLFLLSHHNINFELFSKLVDDEKVGE